MPIACLAGGSLVWDPGHLPIGSEWKVDGPPLPVEFARKSNNGRITLVLVSGVPAVPVLWCELGCKTIDEAKAALLSREGIAAKHADRLIELWSSSHPAKSPIAETVAGWAEEKPSMRSCGLAWSEISEHLRPPKQRGSCQLSWWPQWRSSRSRGALRAPRASANSNRVPPRY